MSPDGLDVKYKSFQASGDVLLLLKLEDGGLAADTDAFIVDLFNFSAVSPNGLYDGIFGFSCISANSKHGCTICPLGKYINHSSNHAISTDNHPDNLVWKFLEILFLAVFMLSSSLSCASLVWPLRSAALAVGGMRSTCSASSLA